MAQAREAKPAMAKTRVMCSTHFVKKKDEPRPMPKRIGRYRILREIGRGGMGIVYEATDSQLDRRLAIKTMTLAREGDEISTRRFLLEARSTASINSAHVVTIHDFGMTEEGMMYIVMELLLGKSLLSLTQERKPIFYERSRKICSQIAIALGASHRAGFIHRDLKPSNVMLIDQDGDKDFVKLLDFGVVRRLNMDFGVTRVGALVGTPEFISPEVVRGDPADRRSDVYSLGVLLYRMVTGSRLFPKEPVEIPGFHHMHSVPQPPRDRAPGVEIPWALQKVILKCLEKDRAKRFASMTEMHQALEDCKQLRPRPTDFDAPSPVDLPIVDGETTGTRGKRVFRGLGDSPEVTK